MTSRLHLIDLLIVAAIMVTGHLEPSMRTELMTVFSSLKRISLAKHKKVV